MTHEIAIAQKIIEDVEKHAPADKIESVTIEVGDLAHLPAHELADVFKRLVPYKVDTVSRKATVVCSCGYEGEPKILLHSHDSTLFECPECAKVPDIKEGHDIILKDIKLK